MSTEQTTERSGEQGQPSVQAASANPVELLDREAKIAEALRTIYDPEIPVNIYELGLVYDLKVDEAGNVTVQMTLTAPNCPEAGSIPGRVEAAVRAVPGVQDVKVELVWEPPWTPARMSEAAKLQLGIFY
jgi:FeS assembly SUF system protein